MARQAGARIFLNDGLNCHGASTMRYNRPKEFGFFSPQ